MPTVVISASFFCALLTISFMHCRNVKLQSHGPSSDKTKKPRRRRYGSGVSYHVLIIDPMRRILEEEGQSRSTGINKPSISAAATSNITRRDAVCLANIMDPFGGRTPYAVWKQLANRARAMKSKPLRAPMTILIPIDAR